MEKNIPLEIAPKKPLGKTEQKILDFIKHSPDITFQDRIKIKNELAKKDIQEVFGLIITMFSWFSLSIAGDLAIKSAVGSAAIIQKSLTWIHLLPTLALNVGNTSLKYIYLRKKFSHLLNKGQSLISVLPIIGVPVMIGILFKDTPTFAKALKLYAKQQNPLSRFTRSVSNGVKNILNKKNTQTKGTIA
jgi:hypothetical protein